jgi:hypothetical protein
MGTVMIRARRRIESIAAIALAAIAGALVLTPQAAAAATPNTHTFSESRTFVSPSLSICVDVTLSGTITYNASRAPTARGAQFSLTSIHLLNPTLRATVHVWTLDAGCTTAKATVSRMTLAQHWNGYGFDPTPMTTRTSYGRNSTYTQYNSGGPGAAFTNLQSVIGAPAMCFHVNVAAEYEGTLKPGSLLHDAGAWASTLCLTPSY